ncbi:hypothetical protein BU17DRAFT_97984 [Hysterangium stoloniferum]|nr:hypothetical protein BU17DRAFT_97984 [Hysterangium stoloniferum]
MQKKAGQISSNTLNLRFMKNAVRAQQDLEVEAAKEKVKINLMIRGTQHYMFLVSISYAELIDISVSYEQSYLPFLFPGFSNGRPSTDVPSTSDAGQESHIERSEHSLYKGRRKFGKHGEEQQVSEPPPTPPEPSQKEIDLPRGARSISSRGRASKSSSKLSQQSRPQQHTSTPKLEHAPESAPSSRNATLEVFMKPQIDAPKPLKRVSDDDGSQVDGQRKRKKRKEWAP